MSGSPTAFQGRDGNAKSVCAKRKTIAARRRTARKARLALDVGFLSEEGCRAGFGEWAIRKESRWYPVTSHYNRWVKDERA